MLSNTIVSAVGLLAIGAVNAAPLEPREPASKFIVNVVNEANSTEFDGTHLSLYHVGAAENAIVATKRRTEETVFVIGNPFPNVKNGASMLYANGSASAIEGTSQAYFVSLTNTRPVHLNHKGDAVPAAPEGYYYINANLSSSGTAGFRNGEASTNPSSTSGALDFDGANSGFNFAAFAVCHVKRALDGNSGKQFLWRSKEVAADTTNQCQDVALYTQAA